MKPLFELPQLLTLDGTAVDAFALPPEDSCTGTGGGCDKGCSGGCSNGCNLGSGNGT